MDCAVAAADAAHLKFGGAGGKSASVHMKSRMQVDSPGAVLALVEHGAGISVLEERTAQPALDSGALVRLLPKWTLPEGGIFAVLPPGRHVPAKVRAFIDFYKAGLKPGLKSAPA